jgi:hypothetical protein
MAVREKAGERLILLVNFAESQQTVSLDQMTRHARAGTSLPADIQINPLDALVLIAPQTTE